MDGLSEASRTAMEAYRNSLSQRRGRVDANWRSIERRAMALDLGAPDGFDGLDGSNDEPSRPLTPVAIAGTPIAAARPRGRRRWKIVAGALTLLAAAAVVAALVPAGQLVREHPGAAADAAAYGAEPEGSDRVATAAEPHSSSADQEVLSRPRVEPQTDAPDISISDVPPSPPSVPSPKRSRRDLSAAPRQAQLVSPPTPTIDARALALREEAALVRRARTALHAGDAAGTLAIAEEHARRFPGGRLGAEIAVLRIGAICRSGRHDAGRAAAAAFLSAHPSSPLGPRVRSFCPGDPEQ